MSSAQIVESLVSSREWFSVNNLIELGLGRRSALRVLREITGATVDRIEVVLNGDHLHLNSLILPKMKDWIGSRRE